jgi:membrane protease YdiL (CAAX protease family)
MVTFILILVITLFNPYIAIGQTTAPILYELLPGGTHFYEGDTKKGIIFLTTETALLSAGIAFKSTAEREKSDELNIPLILAGQVYTIDKCDYSRKKVAESLTYDFPLKSPVECDLSPLTEFILSPFKPKYFLSTFVIAWAGLGVLDGIVAYPKHNHHYRDISRVQIFGDTRNRPSGTALYLGSSSAISLGAAVSEEMFFRGVMLPSLDNSFGPRAGLITTSLSFGLIHLLNPDIDKPAYFFSQATLAGFVFGYMVQREHYSLSKVIAAHFWYDIVSMTTTWLINPQRNPLGVSVQFSY